MADNSLTEPSATTNPTAPAALTQPLPVILCWHMHQPEYRDLRDGSYRQPWTYLHAIKDYSDMAAHLEAVPAARAVINFAPILLEQLADYERHINQFFNNEPAPLPDPLLAALVEPALPTELEQRRLLIKACLRAHGQQVAQLPVYQRLLSIAQRLEPQSDDLGYLHNQYLIDLLVWYHIAWLGESVRRQDHDVQQLIAKERGFTLHERRLLLALIGRVIGDIVPRYRRLLEQGRVELSMSPYAHPILPLLLQLDCASEAMPDAPLPVAKSYPRGYERAVWHMRKGIEVFEAHFGCRPSGCWPSEGAVSDATVALAEEVGFNWLASGGTVLRNSLRAANGDAHQEGNWLFQPYRLQQRGPALFFRDDGLSDLIGFTYANWHADDAVANFISHLENIADHPQRQPEDVVSVILDGENAWQHYPSNGHYFLSALYERLASHPRLQLTTFTGYLAARPAGAEIKSMPHIVPGSWVYGTLSTWIGDSDKNRGWEMLVDAKSSVDRLLEANRLAPERRQRVEKQLAVCEGSDWFWWFGDYNPAETVSDFEWLFRLHLANLYQLIGQEAPAYISEVFTHGSSAATEEGVMRPGIKT